MEVGIAYKKAMSDIRVLRHLDSDTLHLPELRPLIGRDVEIIVRDRTDALAAGSEEFWSPPTLEALARRQGVTRPPAFEKLTGEGWTEAFEGFDEAVETWRNEPWREAEAIEESESDGNVGGA